MATPLHPNVIIPDHLVWTNQPTITGNTAGSALASPVPSLQVVDSGNVNANYYHDITLFLNVNQQPPTSGGQGEITSGSTITVSTDIHGAVDFSNIIIDTAGTYTLIAYGPKPLRKQMSVECNPFALT